MHGDVHWGNGWLVELADSLSWAWLLCRKKDLIKYSIKLGGKYWEHKGYKCEPLWYASAKERKVWIFLCNVALKDPCEHWTLWHWRSLTSRRNSFGFGLKNLISEWEKWRLTWDGLRVGYWITLNRLHVAGGMYPLPDFFKISTFIAREKNCWAVLTQTEWQ